MKLRAVNGGLGSPFVAGRIYDVAEIMELPAHVMVRTLAGEWPKPGNKWFGCHPMEWFERPAEGLPAVSCGYRYVEENCYGVVIPASRQRGIKGFEGKLERAMEGLPKKMRCLWSARYQGVMTKYCFPELERNFCVVGAHHCQLGREVSYRAAAGAIRRVLKAVGLPELSKGIDDLELEFWQTTWRPAGGLTWEPMRPR